MPIGIPRTYDSILFRNFGSIRPFYCIVVYMYVLYVRNKHTNAWLLSLFSSIGSFYSLRWSQKRLVYFNGGLCTYNISRYRLIDLLRHSFCSTVDFYLVVPTIDQTTIRIAGFSSCQFSTFMSYIQYNIKYKYLLHTFYKPTHLYVYMYVRTYIYRNIYVKYVQ